MVWALHRPFPRGPSPKWTALCSWNMIYLGSCGVCEPTGSNKGHTEMDGFQKLCNVVIVRLDFFFHLSLFGHYFIKRNYKMVINLK